MLFILVTGIVLGGFWWQYQNMLGKAVVLDNDQTIEIVKGDSFNRISEKLIAQNIAINPFWFKVIAYESKIVNKLKAGEYQLKKGLTMPAILAIFVQGKSRQYAITFPEGFNFKQIVAEIEKNPYLQKTLDFTDAEAIMAKLGAQYKHPEGLFFPDTYFFEKQATDFSILKMSYDRMQKILDQQWQQREKDLPIKNAYEALILASIIEKETGAAEERTQISGVFTRRLKLGMLLQTDPTVIYGMGDSYDGNIRFKDLRKPTPYNTYVIKGLPPTPIAMPGEAAIQAALHPAKGKSLYFVAKGEGRHVFSSTLREHNNAVNKYQRGK